MANNNVEVLSNRIKSTRRAYKRLARDSARAGAEAAADEARERCPVSPWKKDHLVATIRVETRETKTINEASVLAGDPSSDAAPPATVEFGTGKGYRRPSPGEVVDVEALPATGRQTPWVYFNPYTGEFVTTSGNDPQPFMGPAYPPGREAMMKEAKDRARRIG